MYLDFEEYKPDIQPIGRAISWREGVLLSVIVHLLGIILLLVAPRLFPFDAQAARQRALLAQKPPEQSPRFVFVQPRLDTPARKAPLRADPSDLDRAARSPEKVPLPKNLEPFSRGNTPEKVERADQQSARGQGAAPDPSAGQPQESAEARLPDSSIASLTAPRPSTTPSGAREGSQIPGGVLGNAVRNVQRYVQRDTFDNPGGAGGQFGPEIQFDTKGVEFGPWIRRFIQRVKSNWLIPNEAAWNKGHVVIQFNVHKNGAITDLVVVGPCPIGAFNNAAFGALAASNPLESLPPEYPTEKAFFTVTFFYNETPPR
jgi:hypothetical protein